MTSTQRLIAITNICKNTFNHMVEPRSLLVIPQRYLYHLLKSILPIELLYLNILVHFLVVKITTYFIFQDIIDIIDIAKVPNYEYNDKKKEILFRNVITSVADVIQSIV